MVRLLTILGAAFISTACATQFDAADLSDVYVEDFQSSDFKSCKPEDIDLSHQQASLYFQKAKLVDTKIIHDHYDYAPCYIEGIAKYKGQNCDWQIRAGLTGKMVCGEEVYWFACDTCEGLVVGE